ncbi:hypothetical protein KPATCC21470_0217 [Kitasatospora purpeofusca]
MHRCALDTRGNITHLEEFTRTGNLGSPDGMTVDNDHHLWVALWGGAAGARYHPDGTLSGLVGVQPAGPGRSRTGGRC